MVILIVTSFLDGLKMDTRETSRIILIREVFVYDPDPWVVDEIYILAFRSRRKSFGMGFSTLMSRNKSYLCIGMSLYGPDLSLYL
jgi:hypothetical protein